MSMEQPFMIQLVYWTFALALVPLAVSLVGSLVNIASRRLRRPQVSRPATAMTMRMRMRTRPGPMALGTLAIGPGLRSSGRR